jgi:ABC-type transporter Mla MlaB component
LATVTVRITVVEDRPMRRLRVDGRLTGDEVAELEQLIGPDPKAACLELPDLRSIDAAALAVLRRLRDEGLQMIDVPQHLAWRIEEA